MCQQIDYIKTIEAPFLFIPNCIVYSTARRHFSFCSIIIKYTFPTTMDQRSAIVIAVFLVTFIVSSSFGQV